MAHSGSSPTPAGPGLARGAFPRELVAARRIGRETVTYVSNIYKYYLAYQMMMQADGRREARTTTGKGTSR